MSICSLTIGQRAVLFLGIGLLAAALPLRGQTQEAIEYGGIASESAGAAGSVNGDAVGRLLDTGGSVDTYIPPREGAPIVLDNGASVTAVSGGGRVVTPVANRIPIEVRKGVLVRLPRPASSVFVANPSIADVQVKSPQTIYIFGKGTGETAVYALSGDDTVLFNSLISVQHNLGQFEQAVQAVLPGSNVRVTSVQGALMLTGSVESAREAEDLREIASNFVGQDGRVINRVNINTPNQINLRVRVAEMSRDTLKEFGFNWSAIVRGGGDFFGIARGNPLEAVDPDFGEVNSIFGSIRDSNFELDAFLDALENEGFITTLAEPNLTALSGETASFLAGGEFPVPVPQDNDVITIIFKKFGVGLSFTPTVLANNHINLKVQPEVSQLTQAGAVSIQGFSIPALTTRRAETTVELGSGESFAIAGLLQNDIQRDLSKFPGLGDLPVLGALFRSDRFRRQETELVIIVTPYLVKPVSRNQLVAPTDGLKAPSDAQRLFRGGAYEQTGVGDPIVTRQPEDRRLIGPAGFMLN